MAKLALSKFEKKLINIKLKSNFHATMAPEPTDIIWENYDIGFTE